MKLAIIGASVGQRALHLKARAKGIEILTFAWEKGAVCRDLADRFHPISIVETDRIVEICRAAQVDGVVTNASEQTALAAARISSALGLIGNRPETIVRIQDKGAVREITNRLPSLRPVRVECLEGEGDPGIYPCVVKPVTAGGKRGVSFVQSPDGFAAAVAYARGNADSAVMVEEFVPGHEISVETLSSDGRHLVVQMTDKVNSGPPHFIELAHHQPSDLPSAVLDKVVTAATDVLAALGFESGPAHIEMKVGNDGGIRLVEVNPRGGGDGISNVLVEQSTDFDYVGGMIDVALGRFTPPERICRDKAFVGVFNICGQTEYLADVFRTAPRQPWYFSSKGNVDGPIKPATCNSDCAASFVYKSDHRIEFTAAGASVGNKIPQGGESVCRMEGKCI